MNKIIHEILQYDVIIFDSDGVILDSNDIKTDAFYQSVKEFGENNAKKFVEYHINHTGNSRYEKFDYFFRNILGRSIELKNKYITKYAELVHDLVTNAPITTGCIDFLDLLDGKEKYVISGTDEKELRSIYRKKELDKYFKAVYGSPSTKIEIIENHISYLGKKILFIGDSLVDYEAAKAFSFDFMFISKYSHWEPNIQYNINYRLDTFEDIRRKV